MHESVDSVTKAMAYEAKYARTDEWGKHVWKTADHTQCGVHPQNRGGYYTEGKAVAALGEKILTTGFSIDEADDRGVGIVECPKYERNREHKTILEYNIEQSTKDPILNGSYEETDDVQYGLGHHNHLLNLMCAFIKCLRWQSYINLSQYGIETCRFANRLSVAAVGRHPNGEQLCDYVAKGITFKVLSYKMDKEAPDAMACICHARNFGNKLVLQEGEWSAIKAIHGVSMVGNADKAQVLAYESCLLKLTNVVPPALLDRDGFSELVALVHRLGGNQHGLVDQLLTFGSLMVNHRTTKLRSVCT